jgi:hypothetical protein
MSRANSPQLEDVAVFTQAVEDVFRKLIRFLVGRISLVKLQELIRTIFVEESENRIKKEHPRKSVSLTKLALMSGLDTRTLIKIRNGTNYGKPFHASGAFLTEFTPGVAILDEWSAKPPFYDPVKKSPKVLKISGADASFESLFSLTVKSRGVTANSLMNQLAESGSLKINRKAGTVSLARLSYLPSTMNDQLEAVVVGFSAIGNLIDTVVHNLLSGKTQKNLLSKRGVDLQASSQFWGKEQT